MTEVILTTENLPDSSGDVIERTTVDPPSRPLEITDRFYGCDVEIIEDRDSGVVVERRFDPEDNLPARKVIRSTGVLACQGCALEAMPYAVSTEHREDSFHSDIVMRGIHERDRLEKSAELTQQAGRRCYAFHNGGHTDID